MSARVLPALLPVPLLILLLPAAMLPRAGVLQPLLLTLSVLAAAAVGGTSTAGNIDISSSSIDSSTGRS